MKKLLSAVALCLIVAVLFFGCTDKKTEISDGKPSYEINVKLDGNNLFCTQKATVTNVYREGLDELVFLLYPNAYAEGAEHRAYSAKLPRYGGIELTRLNVDGAETEFAMGEEGQSASFAVPAMAMGDAAEIYMEYSVVLPECALRLGKIRGYYNLSNFYPQLAVFDGEGFRRDLYTAVGDPVFSPVADFKVHMDVPEELVAACPGKVSGEKAADGRKNFTVSVDNARDFALALNADYVVTNGVWNDVTVNYYHTGDETASERTALAVNAIKTFSEAFGDYPYETFTVAVTPFGAEGMEFSGLVFISDEAEDAGSAIVHETAHQWWYNLVGNDNVNDGWLDEGLAAFTTAYYHLLNGDETRFAAELELAEKAYFKYEKLQKLRADGGVVSMTRSIHNYTEYQYNMLAYNKGALMFKNLYDTAGGDKFNKALSYYVRENRFKTAGREELAAAFGKAMKCDAAGLIGGWLSDTAVLTSFTA